MPTDPRSRILTFHGEQSVEDNDTMGEVADIHRRIMEAQKLRNMFISVIFNRDQLVVLCTERAEGGHLKYHKSDTFTGTDALAYFYRYLFASANALQTPPPRKIGQTEVVVLRRLGGKLLCRVPVHRFDVQSGRAPKIQGEDEGKTNARISCRQPPRRTQEMRATGG